MDSELDLARSVIVLPFDEELFELARRDDYAAIYSVIAARLRTQFGAGEREEIGE